MEAYRIVSNDKEFKSAVEAKVNRIIITNKELAKKVKIIHGSSKVAIVAAIASVGSGAVAVANIWNPAGWISGAVGVTAGATAVVSGGTVIITIVIVLGAVVVTAIIKDYKVNIKYKTTLPDGTEIDSEMELNRK